MIIAPRLGLVSDQDLAAAVSFVSGHAMADGNELLVQSLDLPDISLNFLRTNAILLLSLEPSKLVVGVVDPFQTSALDALRFACLPREVDIRIMTLGDVERGLRTLYGADLSADRVEPGSQAVDRPSTDADTLRDLAREEPVIKLLDGLIYDAIEARATDIHIEPKPQSVFVRIRVDGNLKQLTTLGLDQGPPVISRLKILADLDVANSRSPQDGRASIIVRGRSIDIRVSTVPAAYGESIAVRILDRSSIQLDFQSLGLTGESVEILNRLIRKPHGLTIMTGPTGSGKTTTLYAALDQIRSPKLKILTVEDPVEFRFEDVNQVQVNEAAGVSFASTLRAFLRQDPDIILVGEIRDGETASIAVQAALTGHLVLATLHTNDAASAPARLIDMGVEPYLLASVLNGAAAQRLSRRLCPHCSEMEPASSLQVSELRRLGLLADNQPDSALPAFGKAIGCDKCDRTGYFGRIALIEVFEADEGLRAQVHRRTDLDAFRAKLGAKGMTNLAMDGLQKAAKGLTSLDEVLSIVGGLD
jgi:general secretion pathway protein E